MSYEYTVPSTIYSAHKHSICDIQLLENDHYGSLDEIDHFVSLDERGIINVWSLRETEIGRRRNSRTDEPKIGARQMILSPNARCNRVDPLQTIDSRQITSILILDKKSNSEGTPILLAATDGEILSFYWIKKKNKFEIRRTNSIKCQGNANIAKMIVIHVTEPDPENILMTVSRNGQVSFYSQTNSGNIPRSKIEFPNEIPLNIFDLPHVRDNRSTKKDQHTIAVVFPSGIRHINVTRMKMLITVETLNDYKLQTEQNSITCCAKTDDSNYLVLGTKKGIIVLDKTNREILRSSISDNLTSIDICSVTQVESECKYMIISATKKGSSVAYVHGIHIKENLMQWSTNKISSPMNARVTMVAWFRGEEAFDVCESDTDGDEQFTLVAADLKNLVHIKQSDDDFGNTQSLEQFESRVTNISIGKKRKYVSCDDGDIYDVALSSGPPIMQFDGSVEYLKYYNEIDVLIASSQTQYKIETHRSEQIVYDSVLIQNTFLYKDCYIIILKIDGSVEVCDNYSYSSA